MFSKKKIEEKNRPSSKTKTRIVKSDGPELRRTIAGSVKIVAPDVGIR